MRRDFAVLFRSELAGVMLAAELLKRAARLDQGVVVATREELVRSVAVWQTGRKRAHSGRGHCDDFDSGETCERKWSLRRAATV